MFNFKDIQQQLLTLRQQKAKQQTLVFQTKEQLKKVERQKAKIIRGKPDRDELRRLNVKTRTLQTELTKQENELSDFLAAEVTLLTDFWTINDPRQAIEEFSDNFPMLLFPVRLETRFKRLDTNQHQLWVRVFPDECSVDTFEETPTEAEIKNVRNYWISLWKAGKATGISAFLKRHINNLKKGAWKSLIGASSAGRAYWLLQNHQPIDLTALPKRKYVNQVILVIPTDIPIESKPIKIALQTYWTKVYLAAGNNQLAQEAFDEFALVVADREKARSFVQTYVPVNLDTPLPERKEVLHSTLVSFLHFPVLDEVSTKQDSWSQAPHVNTFPDRFVLMGFKDDAEVFPSKLGEPVPQPLVVGPDPSEDLDEILKEAYDNGEIGNGGTSFEDIKDEDKVALYIEYLSSKSETRWMFDFEEAIQNGLGFKIDLTEAQYEAGFDRLMVLGIRMSDDEQTGQANLETLLKHHHYGTNGLGIVPQGTPTNNTDDTKAGYTETDDVDETFERYLSETTLDDPTERRLKKDGRWLAELLGIDAELAGLTKVSHYHGTDQRESIAMDTALWPATIGYFMDSLMGPVFNDRQREVARWYFENHVISRGRLPALRIGDQPYGILPTSAISKLEWLNPATFPFAGMYDILSTLKSLYELLSKVRKDWSAFENDLAHIGKPGDSQSVLLEVLGLHASSQEFYQRYAQGANHLFHYLWWINPATAFLAYGVILSDAQKAGEFLHDLGYQHSDETPAILEKVFFEKNHLLKGPFIDDRPLSEIDPIRGYTPDGRNYIQWLIDGAYQDFSIIRKQENFSGDRPPQALLYHMLRHALNLSFSETSFQLFRGAGLLSNDEVKASRVDAEFMGFSSQSYATSKWEYLNRTENDINPGLSVEKHINQLLQASNPLSKEVETLVKALEVLQHAPTAHLERAFAEHLDACTYRLDAWLLGFVNLQLYAMRYGGDFEQDSFGDLRQGLYLGAYGWVENLKPDDRVLNPVDLSGNAELDKIFNTDQESPLLSDDSNGGYVQAPSLNHAVTAAVLRNAYISNATPENPDAFKVNLSSERVRVALAIIEGMQQGQSLGALLGYQLERGLHDRHELTGIDAYIYELRKAFPLVSNRLKSTRIAEADLESITQTEARNVVDGFRLIEHVRKTNETSYPFGKDLENTNITQAQRDAINAEVDRLRSINDAVADLAMAESVHQVVQGNYDRASGALDAYSKGHYPQMPDVVQTPRTGTGLTHRVSIHLPYHSTTLTDSNPRTVAEPTLNQWLAGMLPDFEKVYCQISYQLPSYDEANPLPVEKSIVSLAALGLEPIDLLYLFSVKDGKSLTVLDDFVLRQVMGTVSRADASIDIQYTVPVANEEAPGQYRLTFFEMAPLVEKLRSLVLAARPLQPSDMALPNEAGQTQDAQVLIDKNRIIPSLEKLKDLALKNIDEGLQNIPYLIYQLKTYLKTNVVDTLIHELDNYVDLFVEQLREANLYGIPGTGFGFVYQRLSAIYEAVYRKVKAYATRWEDKLAHYEDLVNVQFVAATTEKEKFQILHEAEKSISTAYISPLPPTADEYKTLLANGKELAFKDKLQALNSLVAPPYLPKVSNLCEGVRDFLKTGPALHDFDLELLDINDEITQIKVLAEDLVTQAEKLKKVVEERVNKVEALLVGYNSHDLDNHQQGVKILTQAVEILFGEEFKLFPAFTLTPDQSAEIQQSLDNTQQLLAYQKEEQQTDFPVDDWLYGVARVRGKMGDWENITMLAESMKDDLEVSLTPMQFPHHPEDQWLGLGYSEGFKVDEDKLLYTAYLKSFEATQPLSGILIDEWTEVIPTKEETTGLTFHYDQPNQEPPQSLLLVTPTSFTGQWAWADVVDALHETLDLARIRAIEPVHIDATPYAQLLPATVSAVTHYPVTIALNYAINNGLNFK